LPLTKPHIISLFILKLNMKKNHLETVRNDFYQNIKTLLSEARNKTYRAINFLMVETYWNIGKMIVEEEQNGKERAEYGKFLIADLSKKLTNDFGKGFDESNLWNFRQFYLTFPILDTLCRELTWSHYRLIMRIESSLKRDWYIQEAVYENWSVRTLKRQINSLAYDRVLKHQNQKSEILNIENPQKLNYLDIAKDPLVLDFLDIPYPTNFNETQLEQAIIDNLQHFLLELGKGFAFVDRQKRISTDTKHFFIDLVFYNYLAKCFVIVDLKTDELSYQDIGQMDLYVRMFDEKYRVAGDNPTIGIVLCTHRDKTMVKYSVMNESKQLFASVYSLYMPTEQELKAYIETKLSISNL